MKKAVQVGLFPLLSADITHMDTVDGFTIWLADSVLCKRKYDET